MKKLSRKNKGIIVCIAGAAVIVAGVVGYYIYANQSVDVDLSDITTDFTEEQQQADAAKYYHETPTEPSEEILSSLNTPLDEENIVTLENFDVLLDPDYDFQNVYSFVPE